MGRPERPAPGEPSASHERSELEALLDRATARHLLKSLHEPDPAEPPGLAERVKRRLHGRLTARDLLDLCTRGFFSATILPIANRVASISHHVRLARRDPRARAEREETFSRDPF